MVSQTKPLQDKYIKVGSVNTRYWNEGTQGIPIVLLHGGGSAIEVWTHNIHSLAREHCVFAFDMVGSGLSDKPEVAYSLEYQLQFSSRGMD